jgi:hypothetical protein
MSVQHGSAADDNQAHSAAHIEAGVADASPDAAKEDAGAAAGGNAEIAASSSIPPPSSAVVTVAAAAPPSSSSTISTPASSIASAPAASASSSSSKCVPLESFPRDAGGLFLFRVGVGEDLLGGWISLKAEGSLLLGHLRHFLILSHVVRKRRIDLTNLDDEQIDLARHPTFEAQGTLHLPRQPLRNHDNVNHHEQAQQEEEYIPLSEDDTGQLNLLPLRWCCVSGLRD